MQFIYNKIDKTLKNKTNVICPNDEFLSIYINSLNKDNILVVTNSLYEANKLYDSLSNYNDEVLFFPTDEFLSEEIYATSPELTITRLETLNKICSDKKKHIVITNLIGLLRYLPTKETWNESKIYLMKNMEINKDYLIDKLFKIGYSVESFVNKTGDIAKRGYILDIFPCLEDNPIRIEFFGDIIESIRVFDIDSQLSIENIDDITINPMSEFISDKENVIRKQKYLNYYENTNSIVDYLDDSILIYKDINQIKKSYIKLKEDLFEYNIEKKPEIQTNQIFELNDIKSRIELHVNSIDDISDEKYDLVHIFDVKNQNNYEENIDLLKKDIETYLDKGKTIVMFFSSMKQITNIKEVLINNTIITNEYEIKNNKVNLIEKKIGEGFIYEDYVVFGETNI